MMVMVVRKAKCENAGQPCALPSHAGGKDHAKRQCIVE